MTVQMTELAQGVHTTHCCFRHGCKYADPACPVADGTLTQAHPCEMCYDERENLDDLLTSQGATTSWEIELRFAFDPSGQWRRLVNFQDGLDDGFATEADARTFIENLTKSGLYVGATWRPVQVVRIPR